MPPLAPVLGPAFVPVPVPPPPPPPPVFPAPVPDPPSLPCAGVVGGEFPEPPDAQPPPPPPPEPPGAPFVAGELLLSLPLTPPPADVIVEKIEGDPFPGNDPPAPTVIGNPCTAAVIPAGAFRGAFDPGAVVKNL